MAVKMNEIERKLYLSTQIDQLKRIYNNAQGRLDRILLSVNLTEFQRYRTESLLTEIRHIVRSLNHAADAWSSATIPEAYRRGFDVAGEALKRLDITDTVKWDALIHTSAVNVLTDSVTTQLLEANGSINKNLTLFIRRTQQKLIEDKLISEMIADGLITGSPRVTVSDTLLKSMRDKLKDSKYMKINGRYYQPKYYAALIARTRTREATTQGTINTSLQYGNDLVQMSTHADACPICQPLQGRVYSISGTDPDFPMLDTATPIHPHCEHVIGPVTRSFLQRRLGRNYNNIVRLSNSSEPLASHAAYERYIKGEIA